MNWNSLQHINEIDALLQQSFIKPVAFFKHSTRCSTSSMVKDRMQRFWKFEDASLPIYIINVVEQRPLSNYLSEISSVRHESPQLIIIKDAKVIYNASHTEINALDLQEITAKV